MGPEEIVKVVRRCARPVQAARSSARRCFPPPTIKALGGLADGIVLTDSLVPVGVTGNAVLDQFKSEMAEFKADAASTASR